MTRWRFKGATAQPVKIRGAPNVEDRYFAGAAGAAAGAGEAEVAGAALPAVEAAGAGVAAAAACGWAPGLIQQA
jgi:hypothetical protein